MTPEPLMNGHDPADDLSLPPGFQMTELGPLPEHWQVVRLGEVVSRVKGKKPSSTSKTPTKGSLPYLTADYFRTGFAQEFVDRELASSLPLCDSDDVVLIWDGSKAGQVFTGLRGVLASTMVRLAPKSADLSKAYLYFVLIPLFEVLNATTTGTTIPHVNRELLEHQPIPLPPLPEQQAIARVLRTVQGAKEAAARVIQAARDLKQSLMRHLFTYGPVPLDQVHRIPLQDTELGPLPAHWQVVRLGEVVSLGGGVVDPANYRGKRYVGLEHIDSGSVRISRWGDPSSVSSAKSYFTQNQILYGKLRPYLDKAALADFEGICSTDILVFEIDQKVANPLYVAYLLHTKQFIEYANSTSTGVNHPRTSWTALRKWEFSLPPLPEQQAIARILQAVDRKIAAEQARLQALEALFKTLLHHLMTGQVRVVPPTREAAA